MRGKRTTSSSECDGCEPHTCLEFSIESFVAMPVHLALEKKSEKQNGPHPAQRPTAEKNKHT